MHGIAPQMARCVAPRLLFVFLVVRGVAPISIEMLLPDAPIVEGENATLACTVTGSKLAAASIRWFNRTNMVPMTADEGEKVISEEEDNGTFTTRSTYTFLPTKRDNQIRIRCCGKNLLMEHRGEESLEASHLLDVHFLPRVELQPNGVIMQNFGNNLNLSCEHFANPINLTKILWIRDGTVIKSSSGIDTVLSIQHIRHHDAGNYSCELSNSVGTGVSTTNLVVEVIHPPAVQLVLSSNMLVEQDNLNVSMDCNVISANPDDVIEYKWLFKGEVLIKTSDPVYILTEIDRFDSGNYSCKARSSLGWGEESVEQELRIEYLPSPANLYYYPAIIVKGKAFTLSCEVHDLGNPPATKYNWYHYDKLLQNEVNSRVIVNSSTTKLPLKFSCNVANKIGKGLPAHITVPLMTPPTFIQSLAPTYEVSETNPNVTLFCHVECSPYCTIYWLKNGLWIDKSNKDYTITEQALPANVQTNSLASVTSTLKWNFKHWPDGKLKRKINDANYTCEPSENLVGKGVNSTVFFSVQYAPENINLSMDDIDVNEGDIVGKVDCEAAADPEGTYLWVFGGKIVSRNPELNLKDDITKEMGGVYTCIVSNTHGKIEKNITINVLYKPQCEISTEVNTVGKVFINCEFSANPKNLSIEWRFENDTLSDDIISDGMTSSVIFAESPDKCGRYECTGINFLGQSTCVTEFTCVTEVTEVTSSGPEVTEVTSSGPEVTEVTSSGPEVTEVTSSGPEVTSSRPEVTSSGHEVTSSGHEVTSSGYEITSTGQKVTSTGHEVTSTGREVTTTGRDVTSTGREVTSTGHEVTSTGHEVTSTGHEDTSTGHEVTSTGHEVTSSGHEITSSGHEVNQTEYYVADNLHT